MIEYKSMKVLYFNKFFDVPAGRLFTNIVKVFIIFACLDKENNMSSENARFEVVADRGRCCGYGLCAAICPSVYKLDADGLVYLDSKIVPPELEEEAREGAAACPAEAIWLVEIKPEGE